MQEIRFHGRGGQGAVTAAELIAQAAIANGLYAQGFPNFGAERRGAPVMAFLRISKDQIYLRERIDSPDVVVVLDSSLMGLHEVRNGLVPGKTLIINAPVEKLPIYAELNKRYRIGLVDASRIAMQTLGLPITNTAIIGALVKATGIIGPEILEQPFHHRFGRLAEKNLAAMSRAYEEIEFFEPQETDIVEAELQSDYKEYIQSEALYAWQDLAIGCDVQIPGNSMEFETGNWRTGGYPQMDEAKCIHCGLCWVMCPEMAFSGDSDDGYSWNTAYCKGCGICVTTCPKKALSMEVER